MSWRRTGRSLAAVLAVVPLLLVAIAVGWTLGAGAILSTRGGSRIAVVAAVRIYDSLIPGGVSIGASGGKLLGEWVLREVRLRDARGDLLVEADTIRVDWNPLLLVAGIGDARRVEASGVRIHLQSDPSRGSFADLALPGGSEQPTQALGPDLPLFLRVGLELADLEVIVHREASSETLASSESLTAELRAAGRRARLDLRVRAIALPGIGREIESTRIAISWSEPRLRIERLALDTDLGTARAEPARFDAKSKELELRLVVDADERAVRELAGLERLEDLGVEIEIGGDLERIEAKLRVEEAGRVRVALGARGALVPRVDLEATLEIPSVELRRWVEELDLSFGASGQLKLALGEDGEPSLDASLECEGCRIGDLGELRASIDGDLEKLELSASLEKGGTRAAALDGSVRLGEEIELSLRRLESRLRGLRIELAEPARAVLRGGTVGSEGIELRLGEGFVRVSGEVDPGGRSDLELLVGDVDLRDLFAVLPAGLTGIAGGRLELSGPWSDISLAFRGELLRRGYRGRRIGALRVRGVAGDGRLEARGELSRFGAKVASFSAQSPGRLDLGAFRIALPEGGRASGSIVVANLDLSTLGDLVLDSGVSGILNARVEAAGPLDGPRLRVAGEVRALELRGEALGDVDFQAESARRRLTAELSLDGELARSARVELSAKVIFDLLEGRAGLRPDSGARALVALEGVRVDRLGGLVPRLAGGGGELDLSVELAGWPAPRRGRVELRARGASWRGAAIGDAGIELGYRGGRVEGNGFLDGEIVDEVTFDLQIPIELRAGWNPRWSAGGRHSLYAEISGLDLALAGRLPALLSGEESREIVEIDGSLEGTIQVAGNAREPLVSVFFSGRDLSRSGFDIGELDARLDLDEGGVSLHGQLRNEGGRWLDAKSRIPLEVDLEKGSFRWLHDRVHSATLELGRAGGAWIDAAAADRIAFDTSLSGALELGGSVSDLSLQGGARGSLTLKSGASLPLSLSLSADERQGKIELAFGTEGRAALELSGGANLDLARLASDSEEAISKEALGETAFRLEAELDGFDLSVLSPLLGERLYDLRGYLDGGVAAGGTIADPIVSGELRLRGGEITVVDLNQRLREITAAVELEGRVLRLSKLELSSGRGKGAAAGAARLGSGGRLAARLRLALVRFPFVRPGLPEGTIDSRIEMDLSLDEESTAAELSLSETEVRLLTQTALRAPRSVHDMDNVVFVGEQSAEEPSGQSGSEKMELSLEVSDSLLIEGPDVMMRWTGGATLAIDGEESEASGGIRLTSGRFVLLGNDFRVEQGVLTLPGSGGGMPYIDLTARTETSEASVLVTVRGRVTRPDLVLESDPPLTQYQILTLLLTGRTDAGEGGADEDKVRANAVSLLLAFDNTGLERELREKLGIDRISLGVGESVDEPILTVGKRIGDRLYVETEYHHNAPQDENSTTAGVDLSIARNWVLETFYGDAQKGGIDLFWIKRFGKEEDRGSAEK